MAVLTGLCLLIFSLTSSNHIETLVQIKQTAVNFLGGSQSPSKPSFDIDPYPFLGPVAWSAMHARMQAEFTMNGAVPAMDVFYDSYLAGETLPVWTTETINQMVGLVQAKSTEFGTYGKQAILDVISAIEAYPVIGKTVLVVGSVNPWAEAIIIASGAEQVYTVDFNKPVCSDSRIITMDIAELDASTMMYDAVLSFSSLEHDGLGRYGDPMHPYGDVERVKRIKTLVKQGGLFFLAVPTGKDHLVFNAHRVSSWVLLLFTHVDEALL